MSEKVNAMSPNTPCDEIRARLILLSYGELPFEEEESIEFHLAACPNCRAEQADLARLNSAIDDAAIEPSLELLSACRQDLRKQIAVIANANSTWRRWFTVPATWSWIAKPAMATALFAAGFGGASLVPKQNPAVLPSATAVRNVRLIEPSADGSVRIVYDEVNQREVAGRVEDRAVRDLLLNATRDPNDPALRVESIEYLTPRSEREEVRKALVRALASDPNEGVRLKALEALKPYAAENEVRAVLTKVLAADQSAIVRTQTIDLLVSTRRDEAELAGVLQGLMRREGNSYIRQRSQSALRAMNASLETF